MSECLPNWAPLTQIPIGIKIVFSQECFILWTQHLSNIKELLDKKYNKQKVLEWKRKWAHAQLVPGRVYLTPKGGDPRPPVLPPTSTTHNRLLTKLNKRIVMWLKYINMRIGFCGHFPYDSGLFLGCGAVWRHWIQTQQRNEESFRRRLLLFCFDK